MQAFERRVYSFRYTRRGETNMWDAETGTETTVPADAAWDGPGVRLEASAERQEWIQVAIEWTGDSDPDEIRDDAAEQADAEFRRRHPDAVLADS